MSSSRDRNIREFTGSTYHQGMSELLGQGYCPLTVADCIDGRIDALRHPDKDKSNRALQFWGKTFQTDDAVAYWQGKIKVLPGHAMSDMTSRMRVTSRDYLMDPNEFLKLSEKEIDFNTSENTFRFDEPIAKEVWTKLVGSWDKVCEYKDLLRHHRYSDDMAVWFASYWEYKREDSPAVVRIWQMNPLPSSDIDAMYFVNDSKMMPPLKLLGYSLKVIRIDPNFETVRKLVIPDFEQFTIESFEYFAKHPDRLYHLEWRELEELVEAVFHNLGYQTKLGPGRGDRGIDLRLIQKDSIGEIITLVQVKRYDPSRPIQLEAVSALYGIVESEGANRGLFVTTSRYLPGAMSFAEEHKNKLILATGHDVAEWCKYIADRKNID
jgi:hypothetical protein